MRSRSGSDDSDSEDNIALSTLARTGSHALVTGPWNNPLKPKQNFNQSADGCIPVPDWLKGRVLSPIKSFVPVSEQEDNEYFTNQFKYREELVKKRQEKRKRSQGHKGRRKRRKTRRKSKKK